LPKSEQIQCVWSAKSLKQKYDIDHSMPFARWPNNDLWNLLPTDSTINNQKSDRLPTEHKLKAAKERIQYWWQTAWLDNEQLSIQTDNYQRFFAEANIALPGLNAANSSIDDLFEALVMQRERLKEMQQLREW
jgi:ATP-dependent protease HslVU (ClpYQ) ATPase subunit